MGSWVVDVKDFQSLKKVHLSIENGLNIVTGKTNVGKSAVFRAIDAALFNMGDDSMVRGGKRYSGVSIDNGTHKMVFCRDAQGKNEKTAYQFDDGTVQKKVGRSQLPEVAQMFNIRDVRMQNGTKMKINFWYQNDKPFLMDKTAGQLYEFLSLSSCDKYSRILKLMVADLKVQEADINSITTEIDTLKVVNNRKLDFISKNQGFDDLYVRVITADQQRKSLEGIEHILERIQDISNRIRGCRNRLDAVTRKYNSIPISSLSSSFDSTVVSYQDCVSLSQDIKRVVDSKNKVDSLTVSFGMVSSDYERASEVESTAKGRVESVIAIFGDIQVLENALNTCNRVRISMNSLSERINALRDKSSVDISLVSQKIHMIEKSKSYSDDVHTIIVRIQDLSSKISNKGESLESVNKKISDTDIQLEELKKSAGYCPFCGTVFEK